MRRVIVVLLALCVVGMYAGPAVAQSETTTVTLVHGFRGLLADVYLDGQRILEGFAPARSTDPTELPSGEHEVEVREADADPDSEPLLAATLDLPPGADLSAVVHPDQDGNPTVSVFDNAFAAPGGDKSRAVVRHTAVAPAINVSLGDTTVASGINQGDEAERVIAAGSDEVTTVDAESSEQLLAPSRVSAGRDVTVALYLIGSADDGSLGWLSQRLGSGSGTEPIGVHTGNSGLADTAAVPWWTVAAGALALLVLAASAVAVATPALRRARPHSVRT